MLYNFKVGWLMYVHDGSRISTVLNRLEFI